MSFNPLVAHQQLVGRPLPSQRASGLYWKLQGRGVGGWERVAEDTLSPPGPSRAFKMKLFVSTKEARNWIIIIVIMIHSRTKRANE